MRFKLRIEVPDEDQALLVAAALRKLADDLVAGDRSPLVEAVYARRGIYNVHGYKIGTWKAKK